MSFPRYPKYKPSGVEWLGEVPTHWEARPIKHLGRLKGGSGFPHEDQKITGEELPFFKVNALGQADISETLVFGEDSISRMTAKRLGAFVFPAQTLVFAKVGAALLLGRIRLLPREACIDNNMMGVIPDSSISHISFLRYAMSLVRFDVLANPGAVPSLNVSELGDFRLPTPPITEQTRIAEFLDRETTKIDELVAEQRRLVELLKEKRRAVISHAVTRGLNPKAPLKPSGIEWLGDVPGHWEIKPLKYSITKIEQGWSPQCESRPAEDDEWGVLKVGCGNGDQFDPTEQKALPSELAPETHYEVKAGDILVSRGNSLELVGMATFIEEVRPRLLLSDLLYRFRAKHERAESAFIVLSLRSPNVRFQIEREATGTSASMKKIAEGNIREFIIAIPPLDEQRAIVKYIKTEIANLDTLTAEAQRAIKLLQERRTALISAAVTGQIDVSSFAKAPTKDRGAATRDETLLHAAEDPASYGTRV